MRRQVGGNEGDDGPGNEADRLLNFFPGAQAIGADDIDLRFGFVGLAAFDNLRKAGARHAAEIAPGQDHKVRSRACLASIAARSFPTISGSEMQRRREPDFGGNVWSSMWAPAMPA